APLAGALLRLRHDAAVFPRGRRARAVHVSCRSRAASNALAGEGRRAACAAADEVEREVDAARRLEFAAQGLTQERGGSGPHFVKVWIEAAERRCGEGGVEVVEANHRELFRDAGPRRVGGDEPAVGTGGV